MIIIIFILLVIAASYFINKKFLFIFPFAILILIVVYFFFQKQLLPENPPERNKIIFNSKFENVKDSLRIFYNFTKKLPVHKSGYTLFHVSENKKLNIDYLEINGLKHIAKSNKKIPIDEFKNYTPDELLRYCNLVEFLNNNFSSSCNNFYYYMNFTYREYDVKESGEYFSDLQRFIYYYPSNNANYNKQIYKTLDIRDNLILLSYSEAIIW